MKVSHQVYVNPKADNREEAVLAEGVNARWASWVRAPIRDTNGCFNIDKDSKSWDLFRIFRRFYVWADIDEETYHLERRAGDLRTDLGTLRNSMDHEVGRAHEERVNLRRGLDEVVSHIAKSSGKQEAGEGAAYGLAEQVADLRDWKERYIAYTDSLRAQVKVLEQWKDAFANQVLVETAAVVEMGRRIDKLEHKG